MKSYLCAIGTATPGTRIPQMQIAEFMADALQMQEPERRKLKALYRVSGIEQRHSVVPDYAAQQGQFRFYPNTPGLLPFPTVEHRMALFRQHALPLATEAAEDCLQQMAGLDRATISHLISVSCTGMYAPGLDIELVESLGLAGTTQRTCVNFMGCYAAFNALKLADAICKADSAAKVLIICTELCTLHFQNRPEQDHLVSNALFADGSAAALVQAKPVAGSSLSLESFYCDIATEGRQDMAWHIGSTGFEMTLSAYVPDLIKQGIQNLTERLLQQLNLTLSDISRFAIHPGGTRILKAIEEALGLSRTDNRLSYEVLRKYGNMSSVTVLFVLHALLAELGVSDSNQNVLSFAFGPGLTLESMLLRTCYVPE